MTHRLLGELIGLARATEGNEHLISPSVTAVVIKCLAAGEAISEPEMEVLLREVDAEKRNMVPNCFCCAAPCGRNNAFDLGQLEKEAPALRDLKLQLLSRLRQLAAWDCREDPGVYYTGLIAVGIEGIEPRFLTQLLERLSILCK